MEERHEFRLSAKEFEYLKELALDDQSVTRLLGPLQDVNGRGAIIRLSRADAWELGDRLTTRLAMVGFNEDYSISEHGLMLENLIDRFFLP